MSPQTWYISEAEMKLRDMNVLLNYLVQVFVAKIFVQHGLMKYDVCVACVLRDTEVTLYHELHLRTLVKELQCCHSYVYTLIRMHFCVQPTIPDNFSTVWKWCV